MIVKIGGPEARSDMRKVKRMGIEGILAPMVESEYSCETHGEHQGHLRRMDLPSRSEHRDHHRIPQPYLHDGNRRLWPPEPGHRWQDGPFGLHERTGPNEEVLIVTSDIVRRSQAAGKTASVGGAVNPQNAAWVAEMISPDLINTRHMVFALNRTRDIAASVRLGLLFEMELSKKFMEIEPRKEEAYLRRMGTTKEHMGKRVHAAAELMN